jgi:hypothetical protein
MLAHHPITGKPIKIMKTEPHLYKNRKTMVWLRDTPSTFLNPERFSRWETVVVGHEAADQWCKVFGKYPSATLLTTVDRTTLQWIQTKAPKQRQLLFMSKALMDMYGIDTFTKQKFANVICLEEMAEMYPHIQHSYKENDSYAQTVLTIAALFRVSRIIGLTDQELEDPATVSYRSYLTSSYNVELSTLQEPEELWLIQQYYIPKQLKRANELQTCLYKNLENPSIDRIILLNETDLSDKLPQHTKLYKYVLGHRLTYADVVQTIQTKIPENTFVVFANSDIYLDTSWPLWSLNMNNVFLSLLRYEEPEHPEQEAELFGPRADSQDTWVVHSNSVKSRSWDLESLKFEFGQPGCDNAINVEFLKKKFIVANPAFSFKTIHCHGSKLRNYNPANIVDKPIFLYLEPTGLHDLEPLQTLGSYEIAWNQPASFSRRIHSAYEQQLKTFCSMVRRQEVIPLLPDSDNLYIPQIKEQVYKFNNGFTTPNGLVYGYSSIYMGSRQQSKETWAEAKISHMTPSIGVKSVLAVSLPDSVSNNVFQYIHQYLGQILRLKEQGYMGDFWMPRFTERLQDFMQYFKWKEQIMPVIPRDETIVAYGKETYLFAPSSTPSLCTKESVEALRSMLRPYVCSSSNLKKVVLFQDDVFLSTDDCLALENSLEEQGYEVNVIYPERSSPSYILARVLDASICITGPKQEALFWLLPRGARIIELMSELQITGEGAHTAGACSLEYWIILLARTKMETRRQHILERVKKTLEAKPIVEVVETKPIVYLPKGFEGLHAHSNDSFREMVGLWFAHGWIEVEYTTQSPYVWFGSIGDTLLYDRANFNWLNHTPAVYKKVLCGNPDASQIEHGIQWSFWPRHPALVEQRVEQGLPTYEERLNTLVFYGKIENAVQKSHRDNKLYEACDSFSMPLGADVPYTYEHDVYLDKLAHAKFGLCMAGFGPKCNREIECMALGTVPIVAPDVDMEYYANPPQEGVHYLRLKSFNPEDAQALVHSTSEEDWVQLSAAAHAWWKANASVQGLFALTQKLAE